MKVLWLCNSVPAHIRSKIGYRYDTTESWLEELSEQMDLNEEVCFGLISPTTMGLFKKVILGHGSQFFGYPIEIDNESSTDRLEEYFVDVIRDFNPDIVHIFGSEYYHTYAMVKVAHEYCHIVIHLQGIISEYAKHYDDFLPQRILKRQSFKDFIRHDTISKRKEEFANSGKYEILAVEKVLSVMGRTEWDKNWAKEVNKKVHYFKVNEAIRKEFFNKSWKYENCKKHSIFLCKMSYPIKGAHVFIQALKEVVRLYPDTMVYVPGKNLMDRSSLRAILSNDYYQKWIVNSIRDNGLYNHISFVGGLDANGMIDNYLGANVFVLPSLIENSPNSILEAKVLGTPIIASNVGGVSSLVEDETEAFLFESGNVSELVEKICRVFDMGKDVSKVAYCGRERIQEENNATAVFEEVLSVYEEILDN